MAEHMSVAVEQRPKQNIKVSLLFLVILVAVAFGCMFVADRIQHDNGRITIEIGRAHV